MSNLTTPYPSTPYLTGYLRSKGHHVEQVDWSIELIYRLFSRSGLERLRASLENQRTSHRHNRFYQGWLAHFDRYRETVDDVMCFLQGQRPDLAQRMASRQLNQGHRKNESCDTGIGLDILNVDDLFLIGWR